LRASFTGNAHFLVAKSDGSPAVSIGRRRNDRGNRRKARQTGVDDRVKFLYPDALLRSTSSGIYFSYS